MYDRGKRARQHETFAVFAKKWIIVAKILRKNRKNMLIVAFSFQPYIRRKKLNKACLAWRLEEVWNFFIIFILRRAASPCIPGLQVSCCRLLLGQPLLHVGRLYCGMFIPKSNLDIYRKINIHVNLNPPPPPPPVEKKTEIFIFNTKQCYEFRSERFKIYCSSILFAKVLCRIKGHFRFKLIKEYRALLQEDNNGWVSSSK